METMTMATITIAMITIIKDENDNDDKNNDDNYNDDKNLGQGSELQLPSSPGRSESRQLMPEI